MKGYVLLFFFFSVSVSAATNIEKHYLKLEKPSKEHYGTYMDFVRAAEMGNSKALQSLFKLYQQPLESYYRTKLTYDLFSVFSKNPYFYVQTSDAYFKADVCAYSTLLTEVQENKMYQVEFVLNNGPDKNLSKKYLDRFKGFEKLGEDDLKVKRKACF